MDDKLMVFVSPWEAQRPTRIEIGLSRQITRFSRSPLNRFKTRRTWRTSY